MVPPLSLAAGLVVLRSGLVAEGVMVERLGSFMLFVLFRAKASIAAVDRAIAAAIKPGFSFQSSKDL